MSYPKIAVFGAGAVGCYFGFLLKDAGYDVDFIARGTGLEVLKKDGLFIDAFDKGKFHTDINAKAALDDLYDVIFICVKSGDTEAAAKTVKGHLAENAFAVSLQNGVENPDTIAAILGDDKIVPAAIYLTAVMQKKGYLKYMSRGKMLFGTYNGKGGKNCDSLEKILAKTVIDWERDDDIKKSQWKKLLLNISVNPLTALLGLTFGGLLNREDGEYLARKLFDEAKAAAFMAGVDLKDSEFEFVKKQCLAKPNFKTSMLQDVEANRKPETDAMLGVVKRIFEKNGQVAPYTDMLLKIMDIKYGGWFQSSPRLAADVLVAYGDKVLLIERKNEPHGWAIPGGFVDMYEKVEDAAVRELKEETGIDAPISALQLLGIYSDPQRDSRGHTASAVYVYMAEKEAVAGDDAKRAEYFDLNNLPENLAFDHRQIIDDYIKKYKGFCRL